MSRETMPPEPDPDQSFIDKVGSFIDDSLDRMNVSDKLERFRDRVSGASEHIINLIVIFVLQTIIVPIVFLWLLAQGLKSMGARALGGRPD